MSKPRGSKRPFIEAGMSYLAAHFKGAAVSAATNCGLSKNAAIKNN